MISYHAIRVVSILFGKIKRKMGKRIALRQGHCKDMVKMCETLCTDTAKRFCLTNERNSTILILTGAPSPSGKAGDFDSPIVGSTPAGATEKEPAGGLGDRFPAGFIFL